MPHQSRTAAVILASFFTAGCASDAPGLGGKQDGTGATVAGNTGFSGRGGRASRGAGTGRGLPQATGGAANQPTTSGESEVGGQGGQAVSVVEPSSEFVSGRPCDVQPFDIAPGLYATPGALFDLILCGPSVSRVVDRKEAPTLAVLTFQGVKMNCNEVTEIAIGQDNNGDERLAIDEVEYSWNSCSSPDKPGSVHLRTQEEVLDFAGTPRVEGDLFVSLLVKDLSPLSALTEVGGNVLVRETQLASLDGLQNLTTVSDFYISSNEWLVGLTSLSIERLTSLHIAHNPRLESLAGLESLEEGAVHLSSNDALLDLEGLNGLVRVGGLSIGNHNALMNLHALEHPMTMSGQLQIGGNGQLTNCAIRQFLDAAGIPDEVWLASNPSTVNCP